MATKSIQKVGVFVDTANMYHNGGDKLKYDILRDFALRDSSEMMRLNAYVTLDSKRSSDDPEYRNKMNNFFSTLREFGYKVIIKEVKWFYDENGTCFAKANSDLDLAVDMLLQSDNLDRILLVTGDGDFVQVVRALQNKGCRVEVVGVDNVSSDLKKEADMFMSGYLIPNLIPCDNQESLWGEESSMVRGLCYYYESTKKFGYIRYLVRNDPNLCLTNNRKYPESPYETAFFHITDMQNQNIASKLPSRELIFKFRLELSDRKGKKYVAKDISPI